MKNNNLFNIDDNPVKINDELFSLIIIGFSKPSGYDTTVWNYAKKIMERGVELNLIEPYDYGRGKGKYRRINNISYGEIKEKLIYDKKTIEIVKKFINYKNKKTNKKIFMNY